MGSRFAAFHLAGAALAPGVIVAAMVAGMVAAPPVKAADAGAGRALAERWCATCHVVGNGPQSAASDAPTFAAIAARDGDISPAWLAFRLLGPHPQMPQVLLSRAQAADLSAYLATLKK
ncbi:cytochrome c [Xanthobacter autotrophicus]|uniref:c-type cytochrome n=1 Tax=Xanthobacter TaxID=279 RepID=UPI0024AB8D39|nr:c-type cytochrome [Xanthobacter autotrophicus]MDI4666057.1 cytochrome c [Xanthobacter autotrophicus]